MTIITLQTYKHFFYHYCKSLIRSSFFKKKIILTLLYLLSFSLLVLNIIILSLNFDLVLKTLNLDTDVNSTLGSYFIAILLIDLLLHIVMLKINSINVNYYLVLPISKKSIVRYLIITSNFNLLNCLLLLFVLPISLKYLWDYYSYNTIIFLINIIVLVLINNSISILVALLSERRFLIKTLTIIVVLLFLIYYNVLTFPYYELSMKFFNFFIESGSILLFVFLLLFIFINILIERILLIKMYQ